MTEAVSWAGHMRAGVLGWFDGLRPGKFFTFFSDSFPFVFYLISVLDILTSI
jgi:hypothetical protein